jgi:DNA-binding NtrC family response regulator
MYDWPGNIRELRNVIERAVILENMSTLQAESLPGEIVSLAENIISKAPIHKDIQIEKPQSAYEIIIPTEGLSLYEVEKQIIIQALQKTENNQTKTSKLLGISRDVLRYKVKKYRI